MYAPLNIFVGLIDVIVWTTKNEMSLTSDPFLGNFVKYRTDKFPNYNNSNAFFVLFSENGKQTEHFNEDSVCKSNFTAAGVYPDHSEKNVARKIGYYLARSFGIKADSPRCYADGKEYIMHPANYSFEAFRLE